jgi:MFS family permease
VDAFGWRATLVTAAAILLAVTAATWPLRKLIDPPRDPMLAQRLVSLRWTDIIVPLHALSRAPGLWRMAWVGGLLAWPQAVWVTFAATYLVVALGQSLAVAGLVFAAMQATSAAGRVLVGWIADRVATSTVTLALASVASALSTMAFAFASPDWPLWALVLVASVGGISASGWNGVQIAEVARRSPPGLVAETAAGSVVMVYGSNMLAPAAFAAFVAVTGRFDVAFMLSGAVAMVCLPLLYGIDRAPVKPGP